MDSHMVDVVAFHRYRYAVHVQRQEMRRQPQHITHSRVDEALARNSVHQGRHSHSAGAEVWVGLPLSQALFHGSPLLPLAHGPAAPRLVLALGAVLV